MAVYSIDAEKLTRMFYAGAGNLEANKDWINDLNVFPVPDGDTGTNMTMTLSSAVRELQGAAPDLKSVAKAMSFGSLRGARGNSGVILSQLLRGFCKGIQDKDELDAISLAEAVGRAVETAYKAVMKPKEGTILTVARGMADKWAELAADESDLEILMDKVLAHGDTVLAHTPELLPVLKEAGVVDSGGQGLMVFLKGSYQVLLGKDKGEPVVSPAAEAVKPASKITPIFTEPISTDEIKFGYCTEFLINLETPLSEAQEDEFKAFLENLGDSIVMVADDEIVKVHVHTNDPGIAIQKALSYGSLTNMKIDNMRFEHEEKLIRNASAIAAQKAAEKDEAPQAEDRSDFKPFGFVATAVGDGLKAIFRDIGVDAIVEGGQTMNPSAEDILNAVEQVRAETVFILPNNGNIILAAQQVKDMTEDRRIIVIPTKSVPQGITAMTSFMPDASAEENEAAMIESLGTVRFGEVTYAVRDTTISGYAIHEKDIMGLGGPQGIYAVGSDIEAVTLQMVDSMMFEDAALISLYYGEGISSDAVAAVEEKLKEKYPDCDVSVLFGGQPVYYYIGSVE